MKIAAFLYAFPPDRVAGADLMSADLLQGLAEAGHEVTVFSTTACKPRTVYDGAGHQFDGYGTSHGFLHVENKVAWRKVGGWDAVYSHPDLGDEPSRQARRMGIPYIAVVHNTDARTGRYLKANPPDLTVWNAEATRAAHSGTGGIVVRSPLRVGDHYVGLSGLREAVTLVNLTAAKGGALFWRLAEYCGSRSFIGVRGGWGVQMQNHPTGVPLSNVNVMGPLPPRSMRAIWTMTRVLLVPSLSESWGRVAVEAACSGIPVIAHPTPGLQEAMGDAAWWVDRDDDGGWLAALAMLDDPRVYADWAARGRARADALQHLTLRDLGGLVAAVGRL